MSTPLQELGRMIEAVEHHHRSYDVGGSARGVFRPKHQDRLFSTLHEARMALYRVACDLRAESAADLVVQLSSAFVLADVQAGSEPDDETHADLERLRTVIGSTLAIVTRAPRSRDATPMRSEAAQAVALIFDRPPIEEVRA
jgi:hypothetical protein